MRRSKEEAMETRRAILRVALDCFSTRGYALTTFNDIASRIHLTKGAVFWHFKSKEELLAELIVQVHEAYNPLEGVEQAKTLEDIRRAFLDWAQLLASDAEQRRFMFFVMSRVEWSEALKEGLSKRLDRTAISSPFDRLEVCLARLRAEGVFASPLSDCQIASLLFSTFFGIHREAWLHKRDLDVSATIAAGLDFVLQGLRSK